MKVNRTAATIGLALSLSLHTGLFLLTVRPSHPVTATKLKVTLQQNLPQPEDTVRSTVQPRNENPRRLPEPPVPEPVQAVELEPEQQPLRKTIRPRDSEPLARPEPRPLPEPQTVTPPVRQKVEPRPALDSLESQPAATSATTTPTAHRVASIPTATTEKITPPAYIPRKPAYPRLAEQRGWEGTVQLQVVITPEGRVSNASIQHSSGYQVLDRSALQHIRKSRFRPARKNGRAIEMSILLPIVYKLK